MGLVTVSRTYVRCLFDVRGCPRQDLWASRSPARSVWISDGGLRASMIRSVALLVSAIAVSRPGISTREATVYAHVLNEVGAARGFDPLTAVAIIHFETRWQPTQVSPDGEDYGLGQVRARYVGACRSDADPLNAPSEACMAVKRSLLDGTTNIRRMGEIIAANRQLCLKKTGSAAPARWLAGYQGRNFPSSHKWCQPDEKAWRVLAYSRELLASLSKGKARPPAKAVASHRAPSARPTAPAARAAATKSARRATR